MTKFFPKNLGAASSIDGSNGDFISAIQVDNVGAAKQVVAELDAISVAPPVLIETELDSDAVVELPFHEPWFCLNYGFIYLRERTLSPATEVFIKEVKEIEAELTAWQS